MSNSQAGEEIAKVRVALESFRDLNLSVSDLFKALGDMLSVHVQEGDGKRTVQIAWQGRQVLDISVDRGHVMSALNAALDGRLDTEELRNWAEFLLMVDDCFILAPETQHSGQAVIPDVLHCLADNDPKGLDQGGLSYLRQCLLLGALPNQSLL